MSTTWPKLEYSEWKQPTKLFTGFYKSLENLDSVNHPLATTLGTLLFMSAAAVSPLRPFPWGIIISQ
jgi:hypothetical protein